MTRQSRDRIRKGVTGFSNEESALSRPPGPRVRRVLLALLAAVVLATALPATVVGSHPTPRLNRMIEAFDADELNVGIFSRNRDCSNAGALADSTLTFLIYDMEHAPFDVDTARSFLQCMLKLGTTRFPVTPIVRIPGEGGFPDAVTWQTKQVLDAGFFGVMVPHIDSADEAEEVIRAARYPPFADDPRDQRNAGGIRGFAATAASRLWGLSSARYVALADVWPLDPHGELALVLQIESVEAVDRIKSIVDLYPDFTALFVGPADLNCSLGLCGSSTQFGATPELEEAIEEVLEETEEAGIPVGITATAADVVDRLEQGFTWVTVGTDVGLTQEVAAALRVLDEAGKLGSPDAVSGPQATSVVPLGGALLGVPLALVLGVFLAATAAVIWLRNSRWRMR
jgi:4-hydroxy-2-oxoheptanedioate aldolase